MFNELLKNVMNLGIITEDDTKRLTSIELMLLIIERVNGLLEHIDYVDEKLVNLLNTIKTVTIEVLNDWTEDGTLGVLINQTALKMVNDRIDDISTFVTPEQYGAIGDGVTDDTEAFKECVSQGKGVMLFGKEYHLTSPVDNSNVPFMIVSKDTKINGRMVSGFQGNSWHRKIGNYFVLKPTEGDINENGTHYGESAISSEVVPSPSFIGNAVGSFSSALGLDGVTCDIWGSNVIVNSKAGFAGMAIGIEVDVNNYSDDATNTVGVGITGIGTKDCEAGLSIGREDKTSKWIVGARIFKSKTGITINKPTTGMIIDEASTVGIALNNADTTVEGLQVTNGVKGIAVSNTETGIIIRNASDIGINLNSQGIRYTPNHDILDHFRLVRTTDEKVISPNSTYEFFAGEYEGLSVDYAISVSPSFSVPSGLMWCARINGNQPVIRVTNVTAKDITIPSGAWICHIDKFK